jgi:predicted RNase H-like nuclease (RuvC/YqgF family)
MNENYVVDIIANLARRVHSLEQQLRDTQANVEKLAEELEYAKHDSRNALRLGGLAIENVERLDKAEESINMLTDDVITLDERSQVLNAINKYYEEGSR